MSKCEAALPPAGRLPLLVRRRQRPDLTILPVESLALLRRGTDRRAGLLDLPAMTGREPFSSILDEGTSGGRAFPKSFSPHRMAGEEECLLEQYLMIARSVTHAQRIERELRRIGLRVGVFHAPLELTAGRGCAYALTVEPAAIRPAMKAINGMNLRPAAIYFQDEAGYREVAL